MVNIYALVNPNTKNVFYIGACKKNPKYRLIDHKSNNYLPTIIELKSAGISPLVHVLEIVSDERGKERESFWIKRFLTGGAPLENTILESNYTNKPRQVGKGIQQLREEKRLQKKLQPRKRHTRFPL